MCVRPESALCVQERKDAAEHRARGMRTDQVMHGRPRLLEPAAKVAERVPLETEDGAGHLGDGRLAQREGCGDELFRIGQPSLRERQHRLCRPNLEELHGLFELLGDPARCREILGGLRHVPNEDVRHEAIPVPGHEPLAVANPHRHAAEFAAEREALRDRVGSNDRAYAPVERERQGRVVSGPPRELHRLGAQAVAAVARVVVPQRSRESRQ